jgi:hypothetical protein
MTPLNVSFGVKEKFHFLTVAMQEATGGVHEVSYYHPVCTWQPGLTLIV